MRIQGNTNFWHIFNLHNKKNKSMEEQEEVYKARKENQQLDQALYQHDIAKVYEEQAKIENIAKKIARGESLTKEEMELINRVDPEMYRKAEMAKQEGEELKNNIKRAKSKQEARNMLAQACMKSQQMMQVDPQYGSLVMEAIKNSAEDILDSNKITQYEKNRID
ncbi:hypothetical protein ACOAKC_00625 [Hathewaya histolytica]|uniref:hypothetical protein n=1 Tax=Hathewaya histolytica TaxID=1498 RepID=UPI003B683F86